MSGELPQLTKDQMDALSMGDPEDPILNGRYIIHDDICLGTEDGFAIYLLVFGSSPVADNRLFGFTYVHMSTGNDVNQSEVFEVERKTVVKVDYSRKDGKEIWP